MPSLFDCPYIALSPSQARVRLIVATHPTTSTAKPPIGVLRAGTVYELFLTTARLASAQEPEQGLYGPPQWARRSWTSGFAGADFVLQPDGTLQYPAGHPLRVHERRPERNGSMRLVYGARITHCRPCALRSLCLESVTTSKPRQVSAVIWPVHASPSIAPHPALPAAEASSTGSHAPPPPPPQPVLWGDWPRCQLRRRWLHLLRTQTVTISPLAPVEHIPLSDAPISTRAERAHYRLSWQQRLARNVRSLLASAPAITIYGLPSAFAQSVGLPLATLA